MDDQDNRWIMEGKRTDIERYSCGKGRETGKENNTKLKQ